ncbi:MAG: hypothetical protein K2F92_03125 [Alistipes sp.]|nr:hypothetical protein [Alistipes sp.]
MKKLLFILLLAAATGCHKSEEGAPKPAAAEVTVEFTLAGARSAQAVVRSVEGVTPGDPVALAEGTTVRVLAFERAGENADIANDTFVSEATYVADKNGVLTPCVVDADGKIAAGTGISMKLPPAEYAYDFYAITPAMEVPGHKIISVAHGVDYACSLTSKLVEPSVTGTQTVALNTLVRHGAKLTFSVMPIEDLSEEKEITEIAFKTIDLSYMSPAPYVDAICSLWKPDSWTIADDASCRYSIPESKFSAVSGSKVNFVGTDIVLPKKKADFGVKMDVAFNGSETASPLPATIKNMALAAGYHYNFSLKLTGSKLVLILNVIPWTELTWGEGDDYDDGIGEWPHGSVVVGEWWLDITWEETELGGSFIPIVKPGGWIGNPNWDTDIADFPTLTAPLAGNDTWSDGGDSETGLGDSFHGTPANPNWNANNSDSGDMGADA